MFPHFFSTPHGNSRLFPPHLRHTLQEWYDYNLKWNDSEYGGVKDLRITPSKLWKPDVLMYNRSVIASCDIFIFSAVDIHGPDSRTVLYRSEIEV